MISVIIATYNPQDYFLECLKSLEEQSLAKTKFKVYVVFNGTDQNIVNRYKKIISNLDIVADVFSLENSGVSKARNFGIDSSAEEYICFLDDDDILSENYLEELLGSVKDSSIIVSNVLSFYVFNEFKNDYLTLSKSFETKRFLNCRSVFSTVWGKIIPRNVIGSTRFNEALKNGEDALFMFAISKNIINLKSTPLNVYYYRRLREGSASRAKKNLSYIFLNFITQIYLYSFCFLKSPLHYSFIFLIFRYLAIFKKLYMNLKKYFFR